MNAPLHNPPPVGSREELRQYIAENFRLARIFAEHAEHLAEVGMDAELSVATQKFLAAAKAAARTVADLRGADDTLQRLHGDRRAA